MFEFLGNSARFDLAGLGLFDPVVMGLLAVIGLVAAVAMKMMPKPTAKKRAQKVVLPKAATPTVAVSKTLPCASAPVVQPLGDGLARLRTIIETGAAQSEKMSSAHAGASVKIDAAEHALNRMILEMNAVLHTKGAPTALVTVAVPDVVHGLATAAHGRVAA